jgi:S1-C subfamily serine protease
MLSIHGALASLICLSATDLPGRDTLALQAAVERAIARAEPSIVCINIWRGRERFAPNQAISADTVPDSFGSGMIIGPSGLILTCAHVVPPGALAYVRMPGGKGSWADLHASDPRSDLAVLRLQNPVANLPVVKFGEAANLRKGQFAVGLANPYAAGYRDGSPSATFGIISNLRRRAPGKLMTEYERALQSFHRYGTLIQTDIRLNLGCSGGALLNLDGEVIGITTALAALTGIDAPGGFAIPVDARVRHAIEELARGKELEYGLLGVTLGSDARGLPGAHVYTVVPNGPGARAGLQDRDIVVAINGVPIQENDDLFLQISSLSAGSEVRLDVLRGGMRRTLRPAKLAKLFVPGTPVATNRPAPRAGLRVDYGSVLSHRSRSSQIFDAVVIREVVPGSPAAKHEDILQMDRIVTRVNGVPVATPDEFYRAVDGSPGRVELSVVNGDGQEEVVSLEK